MQYGSVFFDFIDVADEKVFTKDLMKRWAHYLLDAYKDVFSEMTSMIDNSSGIQFFINPSLLIETVVDAVIGMKKIVDSKNNSVEKPNAFKIAAYLTYWFLRHKPVSIHLKGIECMENVKIKDEQKHDIFVWQLKHINEYVAAQFALTYIFDFTREICKARNYKRIQKEDDNKLTFRDFEDMKNTVFDKFIYYLSYRAIAPKVIEHILEAYTFHPAWGLTGEHWSTK